MRKILLLIAAVVSVISFVGLGIFLYQNFRPETQEKPPIVDHFACSDYCPGPQEKYMVKIYEGVEDEEECRQIGGEPYTYYGWMEYHICLAKEDSGYYKFKIKNFFSGVSGIIQDLIIRLWKVIII